MTADLVFRLLLGHLIGDYLLQSINMALNKKTSFLWASWHCFVWTLAVGSLLLPEFGKMPLVSLDHISIALILAVIWVSHMLLDFGWGTQYGVVDIWLNMIGSRSYERANTYCNETHPQEYKNYMIAYTAIVQVVADNTIHLILLYMIVKHLLLGA